MNIAIISFSEQGEELGHRVADVLAKAGNTTEHERCQRGYLQKWTEEHFSKNDALIFISSCGIAVRAIAPHLVSKVTDPAVIVIDETGTFCVSLLSGHIGGANLLAGRIATMIDATPIVTTATDRRGIFAVDTWAVNQELVIADKDRILDVSSRLLSGISVSLSTEIPISGAVPKGVHLVNRNADIVVSHHPQSSEVLHLVPPVICLGVGCRRDTPKEKILEALREFTTTYRIHPAAIYKVCSVDLKADEPGLLEFCDTLGLPLTTYSSEELATLTGHFTASDFVKSVTGVDNVCERSAQMGSGEGGKLIVQKKAYNGVTLAAALRPFRITFES